MISLSLSLSVINRSLNLVESWKWRGTAIWNFAFFPTLPLFLPMIQATTTSQCKLSLSLSLYFSNSIIEGRIWIIDIEKNTKRCQLNYKTLDSCLWLFYFLLIIVVFCVYVGWKSEEEAHNRTSNRNSWLFFTMARFAFLMLLSFRYVCELVNSFCLLISLHGFPLWNACPKIVELSLPIK